VSVRFDADGEDYTRALTLGTQTAVTVCGWFMLSVDRNTWSTIFSIDNGTSDNWLMQTGSDGTAMTTVFDATAQQGIGSMTVGTWYFICLATSGTTGSIYYRTASSPTVMAVAVTSVTTNVNAATFRLGESPWGGEWWNGRAAALRLWTAQLSAAEAQQESTQYVPNRLSNLVAWYPLVRAETTDYSGNARTLSGGAGAATEDGPPIPWQMASPRLILPPTAGGAVVTGTANAPLGGLAASATGTPTVVATAAAAFGGLVSTATGAVTHVGTATAPLGALVATVTAVRTTAGVATATFGALAAAAAGDVAVTGAADAPLGELTATAAGTAAVTATATAAFGALTAVGAGTVTTHATANANLGPLVASAAGGVAGVASAAATLGALTAASDGATTVLGSATATFGVLTATTAGLTTGAGSAAAPFVGLLALATGVRIVEAAATAPLGGLAAPATGRRTLLGAASAVFGALVALAAAAAEGTPAARTLYVAADQRVTYPTDNRDATVGSDNRTVAPRQ
jgi:hypothetical protein